MTKRYGITYVSTYDSDKSTALLTHMAEEGWEIHTAKCDHHGWNILWVKEDAVDDSAVRDQGLGFEADFQKWDGP